MEDHPSTKMEEHREGQVNQDELILQQQRQIQQEVRIQVMY